MGRIQAAFEFVRDHVQYRLGNWNRRASETLFEREGSCTNSANLFVAITRAMGIPAAFGVMTVRGQEYFGAATPPGLERWIKPLSRHVYAFAKAGERWMHVDPSDDSLLSLGSQHFNHQSTLVDFSRERGAILSLDESHIVNDEGPVASIDGVMGKRHSLRGRLLARIGNSYVQFLREEGAQCSSSGDAHERFPRFLAERRRFAEYLMFKAMTARSLSGERTRAQAAG
ncbi:MAG: transglutaminase family protein [Planctomycetota bacterium]